VRSGARKGAASAQSIIGLRRCEGVDLLPPRIFRRFCIVTSEHRPLMKVVGRATSRCSSSSGFGVTVRCAGTLSARSIVQPRLVITATASMMPRGGARHSMAANPSAIREETGNMALRSAVTVCLRHARISCRQDLTEGWLQLDAKDRSDDDGDRRR
jgi:hypothetical protein